MNALDPFVKSVHRRWIIVRVLERAGIGLLFGCVIAAAMLPVLLWRSEPTLPLLITSLSMGAVAGLVVGWLRRPDRLSAAMAADRQLDQSDLIATALLLRAAPAPDEWSAAVIAVAERRCRTLSPNAIVLHRLGSRAWGGIGLAAALLFTVSLIFTQPATSRGNRLARGDASSADRARQSVTSSSNRETDFVTSMRQAARHDQQGSGASDDRSLTRANPVEHASDADASADAAAQSGQSPGDAASGAGAGRSNPPRQALPRNPIASTDADIQASLGDDPTGGTGKPVSASGSGHSNDASGTASNASLGSQRIPPWQHITWPADRAAAEQLLRDRSVPSSYRDVVREYFEPEK